MGTISFLLSLLIVVVFITSTAYGIYKTFKKRKQQ
jgi:hypothetical protein